MKRRVSMNVASGRSLLVYEAYKLVVSLFKHCFNMYINHFAVVYVIFKVKFFEINFFSRCIIMLMLLTVKWQIRT